MSRITGDTNMLITVITENLKIGTPPKSEYFLNRSSLNDFISYWCQGRYGQKRRNRIYKNLATKGIATIRIGDVNFMVIRKDTGENIGLDGLPLKHLIDKEEE